MTWDHNSQLRLTGNHSLPLSPFLEVINSLQITMLFIWFCVTWMVGIFAGAMFVIQPLIVLFFGIPFTLRLRRLGVLRGSGPLARYCVSFVLLSLVFAGVTWGVYALLPRAVAGYWVGVAITTLLGLGKCGANPSNIENYLQSNASHLDADALRRHFPTAP